MSLIISDFKLIILLMICNIQISFSQENEILNVVYELDYRTSSSDTIRSKDYFNLVIGKSLSAFDNQSNFKRDSLIENKKNISRQEIKNLYIPNFDFTIIKSPDNLVTYDKASSIEYSRYQEKKLKEWEYIDDSIKTIKGYKCKSAKISYGGRLWTAWYTVEIPVQDGPYKFSGLPGLILEISDEQKFFVFSFHSLRFDATLDLKYRSRDRKASTTNRTKFIVAKQKARSSIETFNEADGVTVTFDQAISRRLSRRLKNRIMIEIE
ncbi:GLPGLI family protein [Nonlabens sp.]|uniref:GLPGLI family protein n=1 Tax=Nonlabens sp. TaxID=1888209 RepID=UPI0032668C06